MNKERCLGRLPKDEGFTFGDGVTKFSMEDRCSNIAIKDGVCEHCHENPNGLVYQPIPETCHIFGPTVWFLTNAALLGHPSKEVLKKAIEGHNRVVASIIMPGKKKLIIKPPSLQYIEVDECIEFREVVEVVLKPIKARGKKITTFLDTNTDLMYERSADGDLMPYLPVAESKAKAMTQETCQPAS